MSGYDVKIIAGEELRDAFRGYMRERNDTEEYREYQKQYQREYRRKKKEELISKLNDFIKNY
tara:strand:+ start:1034 stop:1219 length:186 start_codon:yes stop_codon:yes gene_type:complete